MAVTFNASTSSGLIQTADTSGVISLLNNGTVALTLTSGNLQFNSGYGSAATAYGCRAWVNFNGTGTVAIRASGNVSSITDNGTGDYTVNFTTAMPDANYCTQIMGGRSSNDSLVACSGFISSQTAPTTSVVRIRTHNPAVAYVDFDNVAVAIFR